MFFIISKILHFLIEPFNWILILVFVSLVVNKKWRKKLIIVAVSIFYLFSCGWFISLAHRFYEEETPQISENSHYNYGIVLGGYTSWDRERKMLNFQPTIDRLLYGFKLQDEKMVDTLILSGGSPSIKHTRDSEAFLISEFFKVQMVDRAVVVEGESRNTYENALKCRHILEAAGHKKKVLLITSAVHMPRAKACFKKQGIDVVVYPVDHINPGGLVWYKMILPDMRNIREWNAYTHEWLGYLVYKLRGYI